MIEGPQGSLVESSNENKGATSWSLQTIEITTTWDSHGELDATENESGKDL